MSALTGFAALFGAWADEWWGQFSFMFGPQIELYTSEGGQHMAIGDLDIACTIDSKLHIGEVNESGADINDELVELALLIRLCAVVLACSELRGICTSTCANGANYRILTCSSAPGSKRDGAGPRFAMMAPMPGPPLPIRTGLRTPLLGKILAPPHCRRATRGLAVSLALAASRA